MHVIMCVCVTRLTADIPPLAGLPIPACMHRHDNTWNYMFAGTVEKIPCDAQVMVPLCSLRNQQLLFISGLVFRGRHKWSDEYLKSTPVVKMNTNCSQK